MINSYRFIIVLSFLLLSIFGLGYAFRNYQYHPSPAKEVDRAVEEIRSRVSSISVEESKLVFKDAPQPKFQFRLNIIPKKGEGKDAVYLFDKYEYIIRAGGDEEKIPTTKLCSVIDAIYDRKSPILEALRELKASGKVSFPTWKIFSSEIELGNLTPVLVEYLYSIRRLSEIEATHAEIMIRGYADGEKEHWDRDLLGDYYYDTIPVYPPANPEPENPNSFIKKEELFPVKPKYGNTHLPNLRAFFVKKLLVDPYLECNVKKKPVSHVLQGFEFQALKDKPFERKVQIFVLIYEDNRA
jgi:hypothetical protein